MTLGIMRWVVADATETTAMNAATHLDMALRGQPASDDPPQLVEQAADRASDAIPHLLYGMVTHAVLRAGDA